MTEPTHEERQHTAMALIASLDELEPGGWIPNRKLDLVLKALDAAEQQEREAMGRYVTMRLEMIDRLLQSEILSGNVVKEAHERGARAECIGLLTWLREQDAIRQRQVPGEEGR